MPTVTINIANRGTPESDGGTSSVGHMWYTLTDGDGNKTSYGFSPDESHEGESFAPGKVNANGSDDTFYTSTDYSRTIESVQEQYDAMRAFGENPSAFCNMLSMDGRPS